MIQGEGRKEIKAIEKRVRKIIFKYKSKSNCLFLSEDIWNEGPRCELSKIAEIANKLNRDHLVYKPSNKKV